MFSNFFYIVIYSRPGEATDDNMGYAHFMVHT